MHDLYQELYVKWLRIYFRMGNDKAAAQATLAKFLELGQSRLGRGLR